MMWGYMAAKGIGYGCHIVEFITFKVYCKVPEKHLKDTLNYYDLKSNEITLQQEKCTMPQFLGHQIMVQQARFHSTTLASPVS